MARLRGDPFIRSSGWLVARRQTYRAGTLFVLLFVSLALIVLSRLDHESVRTLRAATDAHLLPVLERISAPAVHVVRFRRNLEDYYDVFARLDELKQENQRLRQWRWRAQQLETQLGAYRKLLHAVKARHDEQRFVTARIVADGRGPFIHSAMINAGSGEGLSEGHPVVNAEGLVGRVIAVAGGAARVLYLTDLNSRVPVFVGDKAVRAVLAGVNAPRPELKFIADKAALEPGDVVYTSGHGGLFPRGLRIGTVASKGREVSVRLYAATDRLEYVSVLLFDGISRSEPPEMTAATDQLVRSEDRDVATGEVAGEVGPSLAGGLLPRRNRLAE